MSHQIISDSRNVTADQLEQGPGRGGLERVVVRSRSGYSAEVYLQGATVTSWRAPDGQELLFLSERAVFQAGKAIRGGIPVIFPQFSGQGPLPTHGLARTAAWQPAEPAVDPQGRTVITLTLSSSPATEAVWPEKFELRYQVAVGEELSTTLTVRNRSEHAFSFQSALHTYFPVTSIGQVSVPGLKGLTYHDNTRDGATEVESADPVVIDREVDRVYTRTPSSLSIRDAGAGRTISIRKTNFADAVLWNPWIEKAQRLSDLGDTEYLNFVCLECGNIAQRIVLEAGAECVMDQTIRVSS